MKAKRKPSGVKSGNAANGKTGLQNGNDTSPGGPSLLALDKRKNGSGTEAGAGVDGKVEEAPTTLASLLKELETQSMRPHDAFGNPLDGTTALESARKLHDIVSKISEIEKQVVHPKEKQRTPEKRLQILKQWLEDKGVTLDGVEFRSNLREGCGVVATRNFQEGELIFTVPEGIMMSQLTAAAAKKDCAVLIQASGLVQELGSLQLALHLLFEKHRPSSDPSPWKGYIESLPGLDDGYFLPLGYSIETLEKLDGTQALYDIYRNLRNFVRQYVQCRSLLASFGHYSPAIARANQWFCYSEWLWAVSIVLVRQNNLPHAVQGASKMSHIVALIPAMDSVNHEPGPITANFDFGQKRMELTAKRDFKAGEQIYFSYGFRPASQLFLYNGFVPAELSPGDRIKVPVSLPKSDPLYKKKAALLKLLEVPTDGLLDLMADGRPGRALTIWVRVTAFTEEADVVEHLRLIIEQNTQALRAQQEAALERKGSGNGIPTTNDGTSEGAKGGADSAQEGGVQENEVRGNGKTKPEQENGTQAGGEAENGATEDLADSETAEDVDPSQSAELQPREAAILVSLIEQTLERYPDVQAIEAAAQGDTPSEGGEKAGPASEGPAASLVGGVQGLGLGLKDPLGKGKKQELDIRSVIRKRELTTSAAMVKLERLMLSRGAERLRSVTHDTAGTDIKSQGQKRIGTENGHGGSKEKQRT
ncbi:hypothetical protein KFL_003280090 [Klebsormidium nitens]|uniref:protein-histidine N-methyltransferase n=1 Tax=Klebsormidium nitens TaxID=105231 RepID=A0A1Y1I7W2_KLENI|nr:hypothetical protein KFL_003280090 [Klebsormidium nitens]|eukprot:GAQ87055.1 hypothetical protein KFL_003280090 [Klebsormidium nitens]